MSLFDAISSGDTARLAAELKSAKDVNELNSDQRTPLIAAAASGHVEMVKLLLAAGAEPSWKDAESETALLKAAANGHAKVVTELLSTASVDERDMAMSFLNAYGKSHGPEYQYDIDETKRKLAELGARAASFVGYDDPQRRLNRLDEAKKKQR